MTHTFLLLVVGFWLGVFCRAADFEGPVWQTLLAFVVTILMTILSVWLAILVVFTGLVQL